MAAAINAIKLFGAVTAPAELDPVGVAVAVPAATAAPAMTRVAVCVTVDVSITVPDTVVVTTTVRVVRPVSVAVTVYQPFPPGPPQPPQPDQPAGQPVHEEEVQDGDQDEHRDDCKDQMDDAGTGSEHAVETQLESAAGVAQWLDQAVGSGAKAEETQEFCYIRLALAMAWIVKHWSEYYRTLRTCPSRSPSPSTAARSSPYLSSCQAGDAGK